MHTSNKTKTSALFLERHIIFIALKKEKREGRGRGKEKEKGKGQGQVLWFYDFWLQVFYIITSCSKKKGEGGEGRLVLIR